MPMFVDIASPNKYDVAFNNHQKDYAIMVLRQNWFEWYMQLVSSLEETARANDAPPEMIKDMAALTALYVHRRNQQQPMAH